MNYTFEFIHTESSQDCFDSLQVINGKYTFTSSSRKFVYFVLGAADEMYWDVEKLNFNQYPSVFIVAFPINCSDHVVWKTMNTMCTVIKAKSMYM